MMTERVHQGGVIWITGLSGAGKTTLARALHARLPGSVFLDGDELREVLGAASSAFDREGRLTLALTYARFCRLLALQGHVVIIATISMFREVHAWNREHLPGYLEVFLDVPEPVRRARDPKGLYQREVEAKQGTMAGDGVTVDIPDSPHMRLSHETPVDEAVDLILERLEED